MIPTFDSFVTLKTDMKNRLRRDATMVSRYLSWVWGWFPVSVFVVKVRVFQWNRLSVFLLQTLPFLGPRTTYRMTDQAVAWYMTSSQSTPNKNRFSIIRIQTNPGWFRMSFSTKRLFWVSLLLSRWQIYSTSKLLRLGGYFLLYWSFYGNDSLHVSPRSPDHLYA